MLQHHWKKVLAVSIKITFVVALFVFLFRPETFGFDPLLFKDVSPSSLWEALKQIDPTTAALWFTFAMGIKIAGIFCGVLRWRILLRAQGVHIPFWYLTKCWFWGRAIGLFLPGTLGLDGYRLVESSRHTGEVVKCTTVIVVEKLTGFIALFSLVFLTLPLGLRLFPINLALLGVVLLALGAFISVTLLLLLQPRIIQVFVASVPLPRKVHVQVHKFAVAATAYSAHRGALFKALGLGICVHLAICLMYFGTASAIRAQGTDLLDILFASPLLIVGTVFAPTVSGVGVREVVMTTLLGGTAGQAQALLFSHLGMWFGDVFPLVLSLPLLLLTGRPNRESLLEEIAAVRA
ncbi:MAG: flippase-like domain-containing protein, partial [Candidatus Hydrogenedentes bacterium]|nr:flippase-like domain-containing protein [Candidatus Hydrogenedentota bacterium]